MTMNLHHQRRNNRHNSSHEDDDEHGNDGVFADGKPATYTRRSLYLFSGLGLCIFLVVIVPTLIATRPTHNRSSIRGTNGEIDPSSTPAPVVVSIPAVPASQSDPTLSKASEPPAVAPTLVMIPTPTTAPPVPTSTASTPQVAHTPSVPASKSVANPTPSQPHHSTPSVQQQPTNPNEPAKPTAVKPKPPVPTANNKPPTTKGNNKPGSPSKPTTPSGPKPTAPTGPKPSAPNPSAPKPTAPKPSAPKPTVPNPAGGSSFAPLYINSGSNEDIVVSDGGKKQWKTDVKPNSRYQLFGQSNTNNKVCERNADEDRVLCSERWYPTDGGYIIPAPMGRYKITMYFEEVIHTDPNFSRQFHIRVENFWVRRFLDIMEVAEGPNILLTVIHEVDLSDGEIDILFRSVAGKDHAKISAVEVVKM